MDPAFELPHLRLVVLGSGADAGRTLLLGDGRHAIGRDPQSDLRLSDPTVSRRHAAITVTSRDSWIEDLGSKGGTKVNRDDVTRPHLLHDGDQIQLGAMRLRLVVDGTSDETTSFPPAPNSAQGQGIGSQHHGTFYNAARDQHISYIQQIKREREPFLREIAATKTKARWLIWIGILTSVVGYGWALFTIGGSFRILVDLMASTGIPDSSVMRQYFGPLIFGVPSLVWACALSAAGNVIIIVGVILHITATARRRRIDRDLPLSGRQE